MTHRLAFLTLICACAAEPPTTMPLAIRVRDDALSGAGSYWASAELGVRALRLHPCERPDERLDWPGLPTSASTVPTRAEVQPWTVGMSEPASLLARRRTALPTGPWCRMDVVMHGPFVGTLVVRQSDAQVQIEVELPDLVMPLDTRFGEVEERVRTVRGREVVEPVVSSLVLELGQAGWLDALEPELVDGDDLEVSADDPVAGPLRAGLVVGAALYVDADDDGVLSDAERRDARLMGFVEL